MIITHVYHNFLVKFKDNSNYKVVAFTVAQIPTSNKKFPKELAGKFYKADIPIFLEEKLSEIIQKFDVKEVFLSYSDLSHEEVMHKVSIALAAGANFSLLGKETMLKSRKPVISVCGIRTGVGKSPVVRKICQILKSNKRVVVIRHPMPYGNLKEQVCQRFANRFDLKSCTIEEREEYEPHIDAGNIVYSGIDMKKILSEAEKEADVIVWDGGNNDLPFIRPDLHIVVADALRSGHELLYHPGETNIRMADIILINKCDVARPEDIQRIVSNAQFANPKAEIIKAMLSISVDYPELIRGKRVLVVEDGPSMTHGGLSFGAGLTAAQSNGALIVNPRMNAVGSLKDVYNRFTHIGPILPAMGYSKEQLKDLEETINSTICDSVLLGTPTDIGSYLKINKPVARAKYELREITKPNLSEMLEKFLR